MRISDWSSDVCSSDLTSTVIGNTTTNDTVRTAQLRRAMIMPPRSPGAAQHIGGPLPPQRLLPTTPRRDVGSGGDGPRPSARRRPASIEHCVVAAPRERNDAETGRAAWREREGQNV